MEKILNITEVFDVTISDDEGNYYDGFEIKTDKNCYYLLINNDQQCCEDWGYISCEDFKTMIGENLESIEVVNTAGEKMNMKLNDIGFYNEDVSHDVSNAMFINLNGPNLNQAQFAVYNHHNGWYGHDVKFLINNAVQHSEIL